MAEQPDRESKTEEPTRHKIEEALKKGNVPLSREVGHFAVIAALALLIPLTAKSLEVGSGQNLAVLLATAHEVRIGTGGDAVAVLGIAARASLEVLALPVAVLAVLGVMASLLQNQPRFALARIKPELSRISIKSNLGRLFGRQGLVEFAKSLGKLTLVLLVTFLFMRGQVVDLVALVQAGPNQIVLGIVDTSVRLFTVIGVALAGLMALDVVWTRVQWLSQLRMTRQEVKDEHRQQDGDPMIKAKRLGAARQRSRKRMLASLPKATLVIANPTHYAVALRYVPDETPTPVVIAKGLEFLALRIRESAHMHDIPIIEDRPLAQALYKGTRVDQPIPPEFYKAVAEVILFLMARDAPSGQPAASHLGAPMPRASPARVESRP